jgi:hypothetical protein
MSIEGVKFCDLCGGVISKYDVAPVRVDEGGHLVEMHLHNRHKGDCLAQQLDLWTEAYAGAIIAAGKAAWTQEAVQHEA